MSTNGNGNHLSSRAMLVSLSLSLWRARKRDKRVTSETATRYSASEKSGNYNKRLLPISGANTYQAVEAAAAAAYEHFRANTLPWLDGARVCSAANYLTLADTVRKDRAAFTAAAEAFRADLPRLVDAVEATGTLGDMFDAADYPEPERLSESFTFEFRTLPLPDAADFRVELGQDEVDAIRAEITAGMEAALSAATADLFERLDVVVGALHRALTEDGGVVKTATLANVREVLDVLPRLNLGADARLNEIHARLVSMLDGVTVQDLSRKAPRTRACVAKRIDAVMADMAAFMGGQS